MNETRVLVAVVDDEEAVRRALTRLLVSAGLDARTYGGGELFLQSLDTWRPDCVVLDLHMPGCSGFDVQTRLASLSNPPPVVAITGHDTPESRLRAMTAGAAAYLRKPVDDKVLLAAVEAAIAGKPGQSFNAEP